MDAEVGDITTRDSPVVLGSSVLGVLYNRSFSPTSTFIFLYLIKIFWLQPCQSITMVGTDHIC